MFTDNLFRQACHKALDEILDQQDKQSHGRMDKIILKPKYGNDLDGDAVVKGTATVTYKLWSKARVSQPK